MRGKKEQVLTFMRGSLCVDNGKMWRKYRIRGWFNEGIFGIIHVYMLKELSAEAERIFRLHTNGKIGRHLKKLLL